jgi:hypothetical protein
MVYSYVAQTITTDPDTEVQIAHDDLRSGFIWVNRTTPWVAISAKDEDISKALAKYLEEQLDTKITRLQIPKQVIIEVETYDRIRRTTHEDHRGIRKRVSGESLSQYPDEIEEVQQRDRLQRRTTCSYNIKLRDGTTFVLGYNGEKGFIYFSKDLLTSVMREFSVGKVLSIYKEVERQREYSPELFIPLSVKNVLSGKRLDTRETLEEIAIRLNEARKEKLSEVTLGLDTLELSRMTSYFNFGATINCLECGDLEEIQCPNCGGTRFLSDVSGVQCAKCDTYLGDYVTCLNGHESHIASYDEVVTLFLRK